MVKSKLKYKIQHWLYNKVGRSYPVQYALALAGLKITTTADTILGIPQEYKDIYRAVQPFTMTSDRDVYAWLRYIDAIQDNSCAIVECGVWRGGMMMAAALRLKQRGLFPVLHLYDTFSGMTPTNDKDAPETREYYLSTRRKDGTSDWCRAEKNEVMNNMAATDYPADRIVYHQGDVIHTFKASDLEDAAIIRVDVDFYEAVAHVLSECIMLNRIAPRHRALIVDDYGTHLGARRATDDIMGRGSPYHRFHTIGNSAVAFEL